MQTRDEWRRLAEKTDNSNAWSTYRLLKCEVRCELREAEKELLRPIYTIRFVAYDSYSGICDRVNTRKKRQILNFAISERVNI